MQLMLKQVLLSLSLPLCNFQCVPAHSKDSVPLAWENSRPSSLPAFLRNATGPGAKKDSCFCRLVCLELTTTACLVLDASLPLFFINSRGEFLELLSFDPPTFVTESVLCTNICIPVRFSLPLKTSRMIHFAMEIFEILATCYSCE